MSTYGRHSIGSHDPVTLTSMPPLTVTTTGIPAQEHVEPDRSERWAVALVWGLGAALLAVLVVGIGYGLGAGAGADLPRQDQQVAQTYPVPTHHGV